MKLNIGKLRPWVTPKIESLVFNILHFLLSLSIISRHISTSFYLPVWLYIFLNYQKSHSTYIIPLLSASLIRLISCFIMQHRQLVMWSKQRNMMWKLQNPWNFGCNIVGVKNFMGKIGKNREIALTSLIYLSIQFSLMKNSLISMCYVRLFLLTLLWNHALESGINWGGPWSPPREILSYLFLPSSLPIIVWHILTSLYTPVWLQIFQNFQK